MPGEMWGRTYQVEKTAGEGAQTGRKSEKELPLGSWGPGAGLRPNSSTLSAPDSRTPGPYLPSSPGVLQAPDPCASPLCPRCPQLGTKGLSPGL